MNRLLLVFAILYSFAVHAQQKLVVLGSSTAAGIGASTADSAWVNRINRYYKYSLGIVDTVYNLAVSGTTVYRAMPAGYVPPASRPVPDTAKNVTAANALLTGTGANGVVIINFPTNGYDGYTPAEIMTCLQTIYNTVVAEGHRCFISTTQPRSDGNFGTPAIKAKLSALKDSIVNRFGIAATLNFWDGMYTPADTTILATYSAGDNVHLNNAGHRELYQRVVAKNIFNVATPQTGDYRSNVTTGLWSNAATWQTYNGTAWVAAVNPPDSNSGAITIRGTDSIRVNNAASMDQVTVLAGGVLAIFNTTAATTFTLANSAGEDLNVYGKLYVSAGATFTGGGSVYIAPGATFILRNQGIHSVSTTNEGFMRISGTGNISGAAILYNNGTLALADFTLNLNNGARLINNDSLAILFASDAYIASTAGNGFLTNTASGVLYKAAATGLASVNATVSFSNAGRVKGSGQFIFQNITANSGVIAPGNSPGIVTVNPAFLTGKSPVLQMEITGSGAVAGTHYDQLQLSTVNSLTTSLSGTTLQLSAADNDTVGTTYTLISSAGTLSGTFAAVNLPSNFGNLAYTANTVTVQKIASNPLPLDLLYFHATAEEGNVTLSWETGRETEGCRFSAERSYDGRIFEPLTDMPAKGRPSAYEYRDIYPGHPDVLYYRLKMTDETGTVSHAPIRVVYPAGTGNISIAPNPVSERLQVTITAAPVTARLVDMSGRLMNSWQLSPGNHTLDMGPYPPGTYQLTISRQQQTVRTVKLVRR